MISIDDDNQPCAQMRQGSILKDMIMNHLVPCPNCGEPFCPDCGEHYPGQVGAVQRGGGGVLPNPNLNVTRPKQQSMTSVRNLVTWESAYPGLDRSILQIFISRMVSSPSIMRLTSVSYNVIAGKIQDRFPDVNTVMAEYANSGSISAVMISLNLLQGELFPPPGVILFWNWVREQLG